jgi:sugar phosphate isomerase/epimerase
MKIFLLTIFVIFIVFKNNAQNIFEKDNLLAWCIVPFDKVKRGPEARIEMLKNLCIKQYAYDWRKEHISSFGSEIELATKNNIKIEAIWMFIDDKTDKIDSLSPDNQRIIEIANSKNLKTTIWLGFNNNFFNGLTHFEKVKKGADFLKYLAPTLATKGFKIALYNHGDWFGEPENEIEIIKASGQKNISIVYSFHHGHHQINRFHSMFLAMKPYLVAVNLDGMDLKKGQILPIGEGTSEKEMIDIIQKSGYNKRIGIIGHTTDEDVEFVLKRNIAGLKSLIN